MRTLMLITGLFFASMLLCGESLPKLRLADCNSQESADDCNLAWDFSQSPKIYYWAQRWHKQTESWESVDSPYSDTRQIGVRIKTPIERGALYRVLGCTDLEAATNCLSSTAVWVPVVPKTPEEAAAIPEVMIVSDGEGSHQSLFIDKQAGLQSQIVQYNVYLLVQELEHASYEDLPPMTEPPDFENGKIANLSLEEVIHVNVYPNYMRKLPRTSDGRKAELSHL